MLLRLVLVFSAHLREHLVLNALGYIPEQGHIAEHFDWSGLDYQVLYIVNAPLFVGAKACLKPSIDNMHLFVQLVRVPALHPCLLEGHHLDASIQDVYILCKLTMYP